MVSFRIRTSPTVRRVLSLAMDGFVPFVFAIELKQVVFITIPDKIVESGDEMPAFRCYMDFFHFFPFFSKRHLRPGGGGNSPRGGCIYP
jgi:hypothetical protein